MNGSNGPYLALLLALLVSCAGEPDLVVYCALDQVHAEPLIRRFEAETGLTVRAEYDIEASKTVGFVNRIREEQNRPRCDVFWNNEIAHTIALANEGLLASYDSPSAADIPDTFRDPERRWTGFAARARVFIVNTDLADPAEIGSMYDLFDERWSGKVGMARPLTGTTLTHMAALFVVLGDERAMDYLERVKAANAAGRLDLTSGNAHTMRRVRDGELAWGWTDTDDYNVARLDGAPVAVVYPDQGGPDAIGTLLIPNTIAVLAAAPHPDAARRFVDWILEPAIEEELAHARSAQIPVRDSVARPAHVMAGDRLRFMEVDFERVGAKLVERQAMLKEMFLD
ncbi:MAG: extracellular solute-binding protein [Planctomycetota bacterium]|nr:extracellular solute-binding protein [Planctomycetota bacterium]